KMLYGFIESSKHLTYNRTHVLEYAGTCVEADICRMPNTIGNFLRKHIRVLNLPDGSPTPTQPPHASIDNPPLTSITPQHTSMPLSTSRESTETTTTTPRLTIRHRRPSTSSTSIVGSSQSSLSSPATERRDSAHPINSRGSTSCDNSGLDLPLTTHTRPSHSDSHTPTHHYSSIHTITTSTGD
ncbi:hypothetical protein ADUPG1_003804, partial [Aduncisulcus paluster]